MTDRDDTLLAKSAQVEQEALEALDRRRCDRRGVGEKVPCPTCESWLSVVIKRSVSQKSESAYLRHRRCLVCSAEYESSESVTRLLKSGVK